MSARKNFHYFDMKNENQLKTTQIVLF